MKSIRVVAALPWEAAIARRELAGSALAGRAEIVCCGIGAERSRRALEDTPPPAGLLVVGCAGGLDPALVSGDLVIPERVLDGTGGDWAVDPEWRGALLGAAERAGFAALGTTLLGSERVLGRVEEKAHAFRETGAVAVDMESAAVARFAAEHGLRFAVVRVILDPASLALTWATLCVTAEGGIAAGGLVRALASGRGEAVRELAALGRARRIATERLRGMLRMAFERPLP